MPVMSRRNTRRYRGPHNFLSCCPDQLAEVIRRLERIERKVESLDRRLAPKKV